MTVGSVRGNERFETPLRVAQGGRSDSSAVAVLSAAPGVRMALPRPEEVLEAARARSLGGQVRLKPPFTERVGWPHWAQ